MNKRTKIVLIIVLIVSVALIQVYNVSRGTEYNWKNIFIGWIVILLIYFVLSFISALKLKKIIANFKNKNFDYVIDAKPFMLSKRHKEKHIFYYMKAISYLEKDDLEMFNSYAEKIDHKDMLFLKCYLKVIYSIIVSDDAGKIEWLEKSKQCRHSKDNEERAKILSLLEKNEDYTDAEIELIKSIYSDKIKKLFKY